MITCPICKEEFKRITNSHLAKIHDMNGAEFARRFSGFDRGYIPWNKGQTRETHASLLKLSRRLSLQKEWNFSKWQKSRPKMDYSIEKSESCAELTGMILGDGCIGKYPRTERLCITCDVSKYNYIRHIIRIIEATFHKKPSMIAKKGQWSYAVDISLYQCKPSERLDIPIGKKIENNAGVPSWIKKKRNFIIKCLKGLFETDGCFQEDKSNYAQFIEFKNFCPQLIVDVYHMLQKLGYHPQLAKHYVRLAKKKEVYEFKKLINFRNYQCPVV